MKGGSLVETTENNSEAVIALQQNHGFVESDVIQTHKIPWHVSQPLSIISSTYLIDCGGKLSQTSCASFLGCMLPHRCSHQILLRIYSPEYHRPAVLR